MTVSSTRRAFCQSFSRTLALAAGMAGAGAPARAGAGLKFGEPAPFSFDALKAQAQARAGEPYAAPAPPAPKWLERIDYDAWGGIRFKESFALFAEGPNPFPATFFHLGKFFEKPVDIFVVENGAARKIIYDAGYFDMPAESPARNLPEGAGFAGFRFQEAKNSPKYDWRTNDWVAFLGASYFRAIGALHQYGLSARAVAVDTALADRAEEFPAFTQIYIGPQSGDQATVWALVEGPSIVGAVQFAMTRGAGVVMDIDQALFLRGDLARLGLAPLTSMYWFSETAKPMAIDWRPEVHDSDGLALWTGAGERLWRPLNDPPRTTTSAFADDNPKGFGLLQRDRVFDHYLDGVFYDRRPSLWVEPKGNWGKGAVQLIELPTDNETQDNVIALWVPEKPAGAGSRFDLSYRLHWLADEPYPSGLAKIVATRLGAGGQPGQPRPANARKFLIEFLGGALTDLPEGVKPALVVEMSRGRPGDDPLVEAAPDDVRGHWRAQFDLLGVEGSDPVELRAVLKLGDKPVSESWLFQYHPF
ncbi:MAG TPA: glucan biosynthesis protein D [Rhodoblastus sp.]|nr:glucan biosynthesis protein D [Rhodoblastus sp.]